MANLDRRVSDADVYRMELGFASRAEAAGFDSVWSSEHHFTDYQLTSQQSMVLSWVAAQTTRVKLGTYVTVLVEGLNIPGGEVVWRRERLAGIELMEELSWSSIVSWVRVAVRQSPH